MTPIKKQQDANEDKSIRLSAYINIAYQIAVDPKYAEAGLYGKAIEMTEKVKVEDPKFFAAHYCLAALYKKTGNKGEALLNINEFIEGSKAAGRDVDPRAVELKAEIEKILTDETNQSISISITYYKLHPKAKAIREKVNTRINATVSGIDNGEIYSFNANRKIDTIKIVKGAFQIENNLEGVVNNFGLIKDASQRGMSIENNISLFYRTRNYGIKIRL